MDVSRATVKWHLHNVFAKTATVNREALLRLLLTPGRHAAALANGAVLVDAFEQARHRIEARRLAASTQGK